MPSSLCVPASSFLLKKKKSSKSSLLFMLQDLTQTSKGMPFSRAVLGPVLGSLPPGWGPAGADGRREAQCEGWPEKDHFL